MRSVLLTFLSGRQPVGEGQRWWSCYLCHQKVVSKSTVQSVQMVEIQTLSLCPLYPSREFPTVVITCVYIPPNAKTRAAVKLVAIDVYPDAPVFITSCKPDCVMPSFHNYVDNKSPLTSGMATCLMHLWLRLIHHSATLTTVLFACCQTTNWYRNVLSHILTDGIPARVLKFLH